MRVLEILEICKRDHDQLLSYSGLCEGSGLVLELLSGCNRHRISRLLQTLERHETLHLGFIQTKTDDADADVTRHGLDLFQAHL